MHNIILNNSLPVITSFGNNFIKINNNKKLYNNLFLFSNGMYNFVSEKLNASNIDLDVIKDHFIKYEKNNLYKDIFLVGCGSNYNIPSEKIRKFASASGFCLEWMTTNSALHNWNILLEDSRDVIALFLWD